MSDEENKGDAGEPQSAASSRLGREVKIGVTVIVVLLITFGAAVALRLKGLVGQDSLASAADAPARAAAAKGPTTTDALLKETKEKYFGNPSPTVVAAKAATAEPPKTSLGDADQWKVVSERTTSPPASTSIPNGPPSFMPDPPKPRADRAELPVIAPPTSTRRPQAPVAPASISEQPRLLEAPAAKPLADTQSPGLVGSRYGSARSERAVKPVSGQGPSLMGTSGEQGQSPANASLLPPVRQSAAAEPATPPPLPASSPTATPAAPSFSPSVTSSAAPMPVAPVASDDDRRAPPTRRDNSSEPATPQYASEMHRAAPPAYSAPARRDDGKYQVQPNDTYWIISQKLYGTNAYFKALAHHNANMGADDDRLKPGELILAPPVAELEKAYPGLCPRPNRREAQQSQTQARISVAALHGSARSGRTYTVVEGDTLFNIARYELGKASRWAEIYELNRDVLGKDFNYLTPGTQLTLPEGQKTDIIAQPPSDSYRR